MIARRGGRDGLDRRWACALAALAGVVLTVSTFYPGQMSGDAIGQLVEARSGRFTDWHPPLMSWVWSRLDRVIPGPLGLTLLHNLAFWGGAGLIVAALRLRPAVSAAAILAIGLYPPIFTALGTLWKDVGMASALVLAFALLLAAERRGSPWALAGAVPPLFYALAVRYNAAPAVLPLLLWAVWIAARRLRRPAGVRAAVIGGVIGVVLLAGAVRGIDRALVDGRRLFTVQEILLHDLAALSLANGAVVAPAVTWRGAPPSLEQVACVYDPRHVSALYNGRYGACAWRFDKVVDAESFGSILRAWRREVSRRPLAYLAHRLRVFAPALGLHGGRACYPLAVGHDPNGLGFEFRRTLRYDVALRLAALLAYGTPLFRAWIYLGAVALLSLRIARLPPGRRLAPAVLAASAGLYGAAYLVVGVDCAFRFGWWIVVAAALMACLVLGSRRERGATA